MTESINHHIAGYRLTEAIGTGGTDSRFRGTFKAEKKPLPAGNTKAIKPIQKRYRSLAELQADQKLSLGDKAGRVHRLWRKGAIRIKMLISIIAVAAMMVLLAIGGLWNYWSSTGTLTLDLGGGVKMEMVMIPAGTFIMGSSNKEQDQAQAEFEEWKKKTKSTASASFTDEGPQHQVKIAQPFFMCKYAVTNRQYRCFKPNHDSGNYRGLSLNGDEQPVVNVSWDDAQAFCRWLSLKTGRPVALPSESQREYVMRGRDGRMFPWGNEWPPPQGAGNFADETLKQKVSIIIKGYTDRFKVSAPVGSFQPNPFGIYDISGNVWEWCQDVYHDSYAGAPTDGTAWEGSGSYRVLRGGGWNTGDRGCLRSAHHHWRPPDGRYDFLGFRVVVDAPGTP